MISFLKVVLGGLSIDSAGLNQGLCSCVRFDSYKWLECVVLCGCFIWLHETMYFTILKLTIKSTIPFFKQKGRNISWIHILVLLCFWRCSLLSTQKDTVNTTPKPNVSGSDYMLAFRYGGLHSLLTATPTYTFDLDVVWRYVQRCYPCKYQTASLLRYFAHSSLKHLQAEARSGPKKLYSDTPGNSTDNTCINIDYSMEDGIYWYETNL